MLIRDARFPTVTTMSSESGHWGPVIVHHRAMAALLRGRCQSFHAQLVHPIAENQAWLQENSGTTPPHLDLTRFGGHLRSGKWA
jgi:hypothetical protein